MRADHRHRLAVLLGAVVLLLAAGCTQLLGGRAEIRERRKFILEGEPLRLNLPLSERPYELKIQVERFAVSRLYDRDQIVFRLTPEEIRDDRNNLWAIRPSEMITKAVSDHLRNARVFTDIRTDFLDVTPDFTLTGTVDAIERFDSGDRWFARLAVTMRLVDRDGKVFWEHRFAPNEVEVYEADLVFMVQAMRDILRQNMSAAIRSLDRALLIRKVSNDPNRDVVALLDAANSAGPQETEVDTTEAIPRETADYLVLPGKRAPEEDEP